jgi:hypothetical protein
MHITMSTGNNVNIAFFILFFSYQPLCYLLLNFHVHVFNHSQQVTLTDF